MILFAKGLEGHCYPIGKGISLIHYLHNARAGKAYFFGYVLLFNACQIYVVGSSAGSALPSLIVLLFKVLLLFVDH